jgi:hypothetical protein
MDEAQIKHMVDRFLMWKLPDNFSPDNGISAVRPNYAPEVSWEPTGTNLLDATQADAMVRHMVEGLPVVNSHATLTAALVEARGALESMERQFGEPIKSEARTALATIEAVPAQTRRDIARAMLRMFEEVEGAAVDRMLSALRFAESNLPAESHPSAIREAVEGEREACAKLVAAYGIAGMPFDVGSWTPGAVAAAIRARGEEKGK